MYEERRLSNRHRGEARAWALCGLNPSRGKKFSSCKKDLLQRPPSPLFNRFPGGKVARGNVEHSPPFNAEVKNKWSYTATHLIYLHGVNREKCTFTCIAIYVKG
jgi:hypothetical protein